MTAKSIISIDVQDEAFKAFLGMFEKYQSALAKSPAAWAGVEKAAKRTFGAAVAGIEKNAQATVKNQAQGNKQLDEMTKKARQTSTVFQSISRSTSTIAKDLTAASLQVAKIAALGLIGGAGGLFGFGALAGSAGNLRRQSMGFGIRPGDLQAAESHYGKWLDVPSTLGNIAGAQSDLEKRRALRFLGVSNSDIQNKNAADLLPGLLTKAAEAFKRGGQTAQYAQATGLDQLFDLNTLRELARLTPKELQETAVRYQASRANGPSDADLRKFQEFNEQVATAGRRIETAFISGLAPLAPNLARLSNAVTGAIDDFLKSPNAGQFIDDFGKAIKEAADYLGSEDFKSASHTFVDSVEFMAGALKLILMGWGKIFDATGSLVKLPSKEDQYGNLPGPKRDTGNQKFGPHSFSENAGKLTPEEKRKLAPRSDSDPGASSMGDGPANFKMAGTPAQRDADQLAILRGELARYAGDSRAAADIARQIAQVQANPQASWSRGAGVPSAARITIQNNTGGNAIVSAAALPL